MNAELPNTDDSKWEIVQVPHDWAISHPFDKEIDKQVVAIEQNGETEATEHTGRTGSLPYIGTGWYRTSFKSSGLGRTILSFDGVMSEPIVYLNGEKVGEWKYGYTPFIIDISNKVKTGGDNILAVKACNIGESSRWYPGAGIYRPVKLIETNPTAFAEWGIDVSNVEFTLDDSQAQFTVSAEVVGDPSNTTVKFELFDGEEQANVFIKQNEYNVAKITVNEPKLWSPNSPNLYNLVCTIYKDENILDIKTTKIGLRNVSYSPNGGFKLNGRVTKIKGVCLHHDLGPLGTAVNKAALIRQIKLLKGMGCNAIRTSHNIPSTWQMDICDSLGMMVMAESFDEWLYPKCKNGYHRFYNEWSVKDIEALVDCHKNHPSIIMWCIGNEIPEQSAPVNGPKNVRLLTDLIHELDPDDGRIVTSGCDKIDDAIESGFAKELDIVGMNYRTHKYQKAYDNTPQKMILGSETASTVSSRGVYKFPVVREDNKMYKDGQCSSYDMEACWWSNIPENDFELQDDKSWVIGEFVWTGFDYLGEPTPYDNYWPSRSSYFGIFDLAGLPKDRYYLYRSRWNETSETLHILPHWTWPGHEGENIPVYCYTSYEEAELFINGISQGVVRKDPNNLNDRYRLKWENTIYEPGTLKIVAKDYNGETIIQEVHTTGIPTTLKLESDRNVLIADGNDLAFITVSLNDANGNFCPTANNNVTVDVEGDGIFKAICNGDATSTEQFNIPQMKLFSGKLVAIVQSTTNKGKITITVSSEGIEPQSISIDTK